MSWRQVTVKSKIDLSDANCYITFDNNANGALFITQKISFAAYNNLLYISKDAGKTWSEVYTNKNNRSKIDDSPNGNVTGIQFAHDNRILLTSEYSLDETLIPLYIFDNKKANWYTKRLRFPLFAKKTNYANAYCPIVLSDKIGILPVLFVTESKCDYLNFYKTSNNGDRWQSTVNLPIYESGFDYTFSDANHGWVIEKGSRNLHYTSDGGITWKSITPQGFPDESIIENIEFIDENMGWCLIYIGDNADGSLKTRLYKSIDKGKSWQML